MTPSTAKPKPPTTTAAALAELETHVAEIRDLEHSMATLSWDQEVMMPAGGAELRAHSLATLTKTIHERWSDPRVARLVKQLQEDANLKPRQRRAVELSARPVREATLLPSELATEIALTKSRALQSWKHARATDDFAHFAPLLERTVELAREKAKLLAGKRGNLYDALIDHYEPDGTSAEFDVVLGELKTVTVPLVEQVVRSKSKASPKLFQKSYPVDAQRAFVLEVVTSMGIDLTRGRLDLSTHPFCGGVGPGDVRMTGRYQAKDLRPGLYGAIHEAGHGLYEQGLDPERARHPLGGAISMAIHESQSRLWENLVGRSRAFWKHFLPKARKAFGATLKGAKLEDVWRASNAMGPSMIRVEADELTYNLHIILSYEIEREMIAGDLAVRDLPERWNSGMRDTLGIVPRTHAEGCLQDIHWAMGAFGYFPTYSLGNLYASQFMEAAARDLPDLPDLIARGELLPLRDWLGRKIHRHDRIYTAPQTVKRVTGRALSVEPFARHIEHKVAQLYG